MQDGLYISAYIAPPGTVPAAHRAWVRHDQNISAWLKRGRRVELAAVWELERISGRKHHGLALPDRAAFLRLLRELLSGAGLSIGDVTDIWGTPGLGSGAHLAVASAAPELPYHSRCHLLGAISSPAKLYSAASRAFGMREGTLMALATASTTTLAPGVGAPFADLRPRGRRLPDGSRVDEEIDRRLQRLVTYASRGGLVDIDQRFSPAENIASAVMKLVQHACVELMSATIERALGTFAIDPTDTALALTGGYALNCPSNSAMLDQFGFAEFLHTPSVSDCGQSIGIALAQFLHHLPGGFSFQFPGAYLGGPAQEADSTDSVTAEFGAYISSVTSYSHHTAVTDLIAGPVAWVQGRSEIGPRALGHRSILADPRTSASRDTLNAIKRRQWWRPVAPIVLADQMWQWFTPGCPSPYMLRTFTIRPDRAHLIPAVAHLDRSARAQTITRRDEPRLHGLISAFAAQTGVPLLCNTSLNDTGEPIIQTAAQAMNFCLRKRLPVLYLDDVRIGITNHHAYPLRHPLRRCESLFSTKQLPGS